jgi:hypothetical protein
VVKQRQGADECGRIHVCRGKHELAQLDVGARGQHGQRVDRNAVAHAVRQDVDLAGCLFWE